MTFTPSGSVPLEVVTRGASVRDPLPVAGSSVVYGDIEAALGMAVSSAAVAWADGQRGSAAKAWQLHVELIAAEAEHKDERLIVSLSVRATLRTRADNRYVAQTQASCRQAGVVSAEKGGPVVYACMTHVGRELAGWLGGIAPTT